MNNQGDHDLLVKIHTLLETQTIPQLSDHENRIRSLERKVWIAAGAATALGSALGSAIGRTFGG